MNDKKYTYKGMTDDGQIIYRRASSDEQAKLLLIRAAEHQGSATTFTDFSVYRNGTWRRISYGF